MYWTFTGDCVKIFNWPQLMGISSGNSEVITNHRQLPINNNLVWTITANSPIDRVTPSIKNPKPNMNLKLGASHS